MRFLLAPQGHFRWAYWLADLCADHKIDFVLGHALYMKAIHGGKTKNNKIDSYKIAALLKGGNFPVAYPYPANWRATRDLLRRRMHLMRKRAELLAHIHNTNSRYGRGKQVGTLIDYRTYQQPTVAAAENCESFGSGVTLGNEVFGSCDEIIKHVLLVSLGATLVPLFTILATTP